MATGSPGAPALATLGSSGSHGPAAGWADATGAHATKSSTTMLRTPGSRRTRLAPRIAGSDRSAPALAALLLRTSDFMSSPRCAARCPTSCTNSGAETHTYGAAPKYVAPTEKSLTHKSPTSNSSHIITMVKFAAAVHIERGKRWAGAVPRPGIRAPMVRGLVRMRVSRRGVLWPSLRATILPRRGPMTPRRRSAAMCSSGSLWASAMPAAARAAAASNS
ncbi:hypothetical protein MCHLDSM_04790 [Mycolicibacterium chlorophenolicum]|uniref:Uncharacterized protein n=1 Tax=Mycolicibacterium chlorophenolicum TaxID=37916 RepID=A0A0J6YE24_9MYCO|nr:hypothetical protein MCHLDSM_04790 [Mycolicibacterium chlorophenolicum]